MQQPPDPAVVSVSDAQVPTQQQKNIFQVRSLLYSLKGICNADVICIMHYFFQSQVLYFVRNDFAASIVYLFLFVCF